MNNLTDVIEGIEKFAYEVMIWVLLIPKTLVQIIVNPSWIPEYITRELDDKTDDRFDSYISPIILILACTLVPIAFVFSAPFPGAAISGPVEAHVRTPMRFVVDVAFIEKTKTYHYVWTADEQDMQEFDHDQLADYVIFKWETPGTKNIQAKVDNGQGESYTKDFKVEIFAENEPLTVHIEDDFYITERSTGQEFLTSLQEPTGILTTFLVLSIPMCFALALNAFRGLPFSRRSFMRSFYIQCYYFSPIILAAWSLLLGAGYFMNPNTEYWLILLPFATILILAFWLFINETKLVMRERKTNLVFGLLFVSVSYALVFALGYIYIKFADNPESFRISLWIFYGIAVLGLSAFGALRLFTNVIRKLF